MWIVERFHEGGLFMYFILLFALLSVGFILERAKALYFQFVETPPDFRKKFLGFVEAGDLQGARRYSENEAKGTAIGRIASLGCRMREAASGEEELQARMDESLSSEISRIDKRTGFLAMFGNVATLLGLLGTIIGMIHSFASVAAANPVDRATLLSKGISEAMNCTAFGLGTAILALVAYAVYQNRSDRIVTQLTELTSSVFHDLLFLTEAGPSKKSGLTSEELLISNNQGNQNSVQPGMDA